MPVSAQPCVSSSLPPLDLNLLEIRVHRVDVADLLVEDTSCLDRDRTSASRRSDRCRRSGRGRTRRRAPGSCRAARRSDCRAPGRRRSAHPSSSSRRRRRSRRFSAARSVRQRVVVLARRRTSASRSPLCTAADCSGILPSACRTCSSPSVHQRRLLGGEVAFRMTRQLDASRHACRPHVDVTVGQRAGDDAVVVVRDIAAPPSAPCGRRSSIP